MKTSVRRSRSSVEPLYLSIALLAAVELREAAARAVDEVDIEGAPIDLAAA